MKKILLILPIRGPRSPTEYHEAGETIIVTDQAAKSIVNRGAGIIVGEVEDRDDSGTGESVFRDPSGKRNVGSGLPQGKGGSTGNRRSGNKKSAAKTKRGSGENPESNL